MAQNQNQMGGMTPPMKRIKHSTVIEEPHGFQHPQSPQGFGGFLQNMVHPAFRTMRPGEQFGQPQPQPQPYRPQPAPQPGMMSPVPMPAWNPGRIPPPFTGGGFNPNPGVPPFMHPNPMPYQPSMNPGLPQDHPMNDYFRRMLGGAPMRQWGGGMGY